MTIVIHERALYKNMSARVTQQSLQTLSDMILRVLFSSFYPLLPVSVNLSQQSVLVGFWRGVCGRGGSRAASEGGEMTALNPHRLIVDW